MVWMTIPRGLFNRGGQFPMLVTLPEMRTLLTQQPSANASPLWFERAKDRKDWLPCGSGFIIGL
jgi:hypothetical protein